jgi:restriction endonuclease Mrr
MAIPDFQTVMLPVLHLASNGEVRASDAIDRIAAEFHLTPEERSELLPSGRQAKIANRVHWAVTYLVKAGLLDRPRRGVFGIPASLRFDLRSFAAARRAYSSPLISAGSALTYQRVAFERRGSTTIESEPENGFTLLAFAAAPRHPPGRRSLKARPRPRPGRCY